MPKTLALTGVMLTYDGFRARRRLFTCLSVYELWLTLALEYSTYMLDRDPQHFPHLYVYLARHLLD